jgi:predicted HTH transcriptional regulator
MIVAAVDIELDEVDRQMVDYMAKRGKARAGELSEVVGITVPSIRYRIFQLMAKGIVCQEKSRKHQVWWFLQENEKARFEGTRETSRKDTGGTNVSKRGY